MGSAASKKDKAVAKSNDPPASAPSIQQKSGGGPGGQPKRPVRKRRESVSAECPSQIPAWKKETIPKSDDAKERIRKAVKDNFLFTSLDAAQFQDIIDVMGEKKVFSGDTIITEGESGDFFYVIDEGDFEVLVKDKVVLNLKGGGSFGELALMYNCPRAATVKCKGSGSLWTIDRESFRNIIMIANQKKAAMYEEFLKEVPIFQNLTHSERSQIADNLSPQSHENGETIIKQGDCDFEKMKFYLLVKGECQCYFVDDDGSRLDAGKVKRGGYFGEKALLEQKARAADVVAQGNDCETVSMDVAAFERLLGPCIDLMHRQIKSYKTIDSSRTESIGDMKEWKRSIDKEAEAKSVDSKLEPADAKEASMDAKAEAK